MSGGLIELLDTRPFLSAWFWLWFVTSWSWAGRHVLGVPMDVVHAARKALGAEAPPPDAPAALVLFDWLSLHVPRARPGRRETQMLLAGSGFVAAGLFVLGFRFGVSMAQALFLFVVPFIALFWMRVRLAECLVPLLDEASRGRPVNETARDVLRVIGIHRALFHLLSIASVVITGLWGMLWLLTHPNGL
ncbi:MAG: hypothetical protein Q4G36_01985 [Paracoccus sp. (in: a-proteobacteria)]|nr:hypothetical protein [Paracoccus sp. (in: a-proteobacteria)]